MKILIATALLLLIIGTATATQLDSLKAPNGYEDMVAGMTQKLDDSHVFLCTDKMEYNQNVFENYTDNLTDQTVTPLGNNIYKYVDTKLNCCGVQEKVKLDGIEYLVYIEDDNGVDGDIDSYLASMKEFNKANNLQPMTV